MSNNNYNKEQIIKIEQEIFHLAPINKKQYTLEIDLDNFDDFLSRKLPSLLDKDLKPSLIYDYEFADELIQPIKNQINLLLKNTLEFLAENKGLNINSIKIFAKGTLILVIPIYILLNSGIATASDDKLSMSYIYLGTENQQMEHINQTQKSLNIVSPDYFYLSNDGNLEFNDISSTFINYAHSKGLKVIPYLSNGWNRQKGINALDNMEKLATGLTRTIIDNKLDGINIDLEALTENERDDYVSFIKLLKGKLPLGKEISVAVAANPKNYQTGWHASYDYAGLAKYADYLIIMAYDEHYGGSSPGPVASIDFVEDSIDFALSKTSADKLVLGIPFYGRIWSTSTDSIMGQGLTLNTIIAMIENYQGEIHYSETYNSPYASITVNKNDPIVSFGWVTLNPGDYIIWFENSDSLKSKLALVQKYNLRGAASWSLGEEPNDVWDYYSLWLNGKYFSDIDNSFAKDDIIKAALSGLMVGITENQFGPEQGLTRAQAAVIFCRALDLSLDTEKAPFKDTKGHWAEADISAAYQAGLVFGYENGTFRPNDNLTREEVAVLLARIVDLSTLDESTGNITFSDIQEGRWSYQEITALANANILKGYENHVFAPAKVLSRAEMAALLERIDEYLPK